MKLNHKPTQKLCKQSIGLFDSVFTYFIKCGTGNLVWQIFDTAFWFWQYQYMICLIHYCYILWVITVVTLFDTFLIHFFLCWQHQNIFSNTFLSDFNKKTKLQQDTRLSTESNQCMDSISTITTEQSRNLTNICRQQLSSTKGTSNASKSHTSSWHPCTISLFLLWYVFVCFLLLSLFLCLFCTQGFAVFFCFFWGY